MLTAQLGRQAAQDVYQQRAARLPQATPAQIFTAVQTDGLFRDSSLEIADHHAAGGSTTYVYPFDYVPAEDPHAPGCHPLRRTALSLQHLRGLPRQPILAGAGHTEHALGQESASAVAEFVTAGTASGWLPYAPATAARIRHFG
ncbi:hypothetical protein [Streptomyces sp. NPDC007206]|uniref:hypothetical protein n=1 Tax=Streptomyces sp. NPDC007206 TaxID=3154317 RepID=UPI0033DBFE2C